VQRRTKIVATLGPASETQDGIEGLVRAGLDVARINLSHGTIDEHLKRIEMVRAAAKAAGRPIGILADLPGPKVRSGVFPEGGVFLMEGSVVRLTAGVAPSSAEVISVDYPSLVEDLRPGDDVILGDGAITLRVDSVHDGHVTATVITGGRAQGRPGVHIPAERLRLSAPTAEDLRLLQVVTEAEVDFVAVSFVRGAADLSEVRAEGGPSCPMLVAKIETAPAVADLDAILHVADAVMVARGDLGIELPLEEVPHVQKRVIRRCVTAGVPVITATQMLESMVSSPAPTRAEVSDVANAVFDGTDALMLSGETAIGHDPALVVRTMARIAKRAEAEADYTQWGSHLGRLQRRGALDDHAQIAAGITHAAWQAAADVGAEAILCCTRSGFTARAMARFRPTARLVGLSPDERATRQLSLSWGVVPLRVEEYESTDDMVWCVTEAAVRDGLLHHGQTAVVLAGAPDSAVGAVDVLRVVRIE
jgi:pyruvate kinase